MNKTSSPICRVASRKRCPTLNSPVGSPNVKSHHLTPSGKGHQRSKSDATGIKKSVTKYLYIVFYTVNHFNMIALQCLYRPLLFDTLRGYSIQPTSSSPDITDLVNFNAKDSGPYTYKFKKKRRKFV